MSGEPAPEEDYSKLSIDELINHKAWRARQKGYEQCRKEFDMAEPKDAVFLRQLGSLKKFAADTNVMALEKGVEAVLSFVSNAAVAPKAAGELCPVLVQKCIAHTKVKVRETGVNVLLLFIEIEKQDVVVESLVEGLQNKNPKVVKESVATLTQAVREFGARPLGVKAASKHLGALMEHANADVRDQTKAFAIELYRWVGEAFKSQLQSLKPIQLAELSAEFAAVADEAARRPTRRIRSQADEAAASADGAAPSSAAATALAPQTEAIAVDPLEDCAPVDVLAMLPSDFYEQLESSKWAERHAALERLVQLMAANPRLDPKAQYGEIANVLKKTLGKDANVKVVTAAAQCVRGLAYGLRRKFGQYAVMVAPAVFERLKDKNKLQAEALREAVDELLKTTTLDALGDEVVSALQKPSPQQRIQTALFLQRAFKGCSQKNLPKKLLTALAPPLVKNMADPDAEVRAATAAAIGQLMKAVGEKPVLPFLADIADDKLKMAKIQEYHVKAIQECSNEMVTSMVQSMHRTNDDDEDLSMEAEKPAAPPPSRKPAAPRKAAAKAQMPTSKSTPNFASDDGAVSLPPPPPPPKGPVRKPTQVVAEGDDLDAIAVEDLILQKSWKARQVGFERAAKLFASLEPRDERFDEFVGLAPSFAADPNAFALEKALDALLLFVDCAAVALHSTTEVAPALVQKCLSHAKANIRATAANVLFMYIEIGQQDVVVDALVSGMQSKNPKLVRECAQTMRVAVSSFGAKTLGVKSAMKLVGGLLDNANPDVREQTKQFVVEVYRWVGDALKPQLAGLKADKLASLTGAFASLGDEPAEPTRFIRGRQTKRVAAAAVGAVDGEGAGASEEAADAEEEAPDAWESAPAVDVLSKLPVDFYENLSSKKWTERLTGLTWLADKVAVADLKLDPKAQYDEVITTLTQTVGQDSNVKVVVAAARSLGGIANGLRNKFTMHAAMTMPVLLDRFKDKNKLQVEALREAVDAVGRTATLEQLCDDLVAKLAHKSPSIRIQTSWFLHRFLNACRKQAQLPKKILLALAPVLVKNLADPDPEVRDAAAAVLGAAMRVAGEKPVMQQLNADDKLKVAKVQEYFAKVTEDYGPVKAAAQPAAKPKAAPSTKPAAAAAPTRRGEVRAKPATPRASSAAPPLAARGRSSSRKPGENGRSTKETAEDAFEGGCLVDTDQKTARLKAERALKTLKWNFSEPTPEHVEQLKVQLATVCKPALLSQLFHADFKQHLKAIDALNAALDQCVAAAVGASDLLLRWCTLRFYDTNPSVLLKCLEFIITFVQVFEEKNEKLTDSEIVSFVPYLIIKAGEPKEVVRQHVRTIFERLCRLYPASKLFPLILEGTKTKNSRQKTECLDQLAQLIEVEGMPVCGAAQTSLPLIAQCIGDRDNSVRNAALNAVVAAHMHIGEKVFKFVGALNDKELAMLEERIRRTAASKASRPLIRRAPPAAAADDGRKSVARPAVVQNGVTENGAADEAAPKRSPSRCRGTTPGMFQLDVESIYPAAERAEARVETPQLIDMTEICQLLDAKPVEMPRTRSALLPLSPAKRSSSQTSVNSMDASVALDTVISQVTSSTIESAVQAVVQLDELVKDASKTSSLTGKVDQLLMALYFQLHMVYSNHLSNDEIDSDRIIQLYRSLCSMLLSLLKCESLAREATEGPLKDLACQLLTVLLDERLNQLQEGNQVVRSINVITVKLVEKSDPTVCLLALLKLLRETLRSQTASTKFQELVMKCLWKHCRRLPSVVNELNLSKIMLGTHQFLVEFPSELWKQQQQSDTPARTVKTIVNTLAKHVGDRILDHVDLIEQPQQSELVVYVRRCLREFARQNVLPGQVDENRRPPVAAPNTATYDKRTTPTDSAQQHAGRLGEIFKRISEKEHTRQGVRDLYAFKRAHPLVDLEPFLQKSTPFFRSYVERALQTAALEEANNNEPAAPVVVTHAEPLAALARLNELRARAGLAVAAPAPADSFNDGISLPQVRMSSPRQTRRPAEQREADGTGDAPADPMPPPPDLNVLKQRLDMIKRRSHV